MAFLQAEEKTSAEYLGALQKKPTHLGPSVKAL